MLRKSFLFALLCLSSLLAVPSLSAPAAQPTASVSYGAVTGVGGSFTLWSQSGAELAQLRVQSHGDRILATMRTTRMGNLHFLFGDVTFNEDFTVVDYRFSQYGQEILIRVDRSDMFNVTGRWLKRPARD